LTLFRAPASDRDIVQFVAVATGKAANSTGALLVALLIGRHLGPDGLGQWTLVAAGAALLHTSLASWTQPAMVRFGCEEWGRSHALNRTLGVRLPFMALSLLLALLTLTVAPERWLAPLIGLPASMVWLLGLYFLSQWMSTEAQLLLQATNRLAQIALLSPAVAGLAVAALFGLSALQELTVPTAVLAVAGAAVLVWGTVLVRTVLLVRWRWETPRRSEVAGYLGYSLPLFGAFAVGYVSGWGDHLLLRMFVSITAVGVFGLSYQMFATLVTANGLLPTVLLPRLIARQLDASDTIRRYVETVIPTLLTFWILASIWAVAALPVLLPVLAGGAFLPSLAPLRILLIAVPGNAVAALYTVVFNLEQRTKAMLGYQVAMAVVNILMSLLLIPPAGVPGAAIATALSHLLVQALYLSDHHRRLHISPVPVAMLWLASAGAGLLQVRVEQGWMRIAWALVTTVLLVVVARAVRAVNPDIVPRIFSGPLSAVAPFVNRALVAARN
jgi:O-antigen/teichoic acid export membrane protein